MKPSEVQIHQFWSIRNFFPPLLLAQIFAANPSPSSPRFCFCNTEMQKKKKKKNPSPRVSGANKTCPVWGIHCNAKQISNASASLKALLSITMSRAFRADGLLVRGGGVEPVVKFQTALKEPLGTLNIKQILEGHHTHTRTRARAHKDGFFRWCIR